MRVAFGVLGAQAYRLQQLVHNLHALLFGEIGVDEQRLFYQILNTHAGV